MEENIQPMDRLYRDQHGIVVHVTGYDAGRQRVIYRRQAMSGNVLHRRSFSAPDLRGLISER